MPRAANPEPRRQTWSGTGQAWTALSELISAIVVWGGIGYGLDHLLGTRPVLFVIGMVLGNGAGAYLVYRRGVGPQQTAAGKDDQDT